MLDTSKLSLSESRRMGAASMMVFQCARSMREKVVVCTGKIIVIEQVPNKDRGHERVPL